MRLSKFLYFFVLKYFGVRFKTNSAVLLIKKTRNPRTAAITFFEVFWRKIKVCIQFTLKALKGFSPISLLFLRRWKINFEKFYKGLLINYTVEPTGVLLISSYLLAWQKDICSNFLIVRLLTWYFVNLLICLVTFILKRFFIVLFLVAQHLLSYISP